MNAVGSVENAPMATQASAPVTVMVSPAAQRNFQRLVEAAGKGSLQEYLQSLVDAFEHEETVRVALFTLKMARLGQGKAKG